MSEFYGQYTSKGHTYFYGIVHIENTTETVYGKITSVSLRRNLKTHATEEEALLYFEKKSVERLEKGYTETKHHVGDLYTIADIQYSDGEGEGDGSFEMEVEGGWECEGRGEEREEEGEGWGEGEGLWEGEGEGLGECDCCDAGCPVCVAYDQSLLECPVCHTGEATGENRLCRRCEKYHWQQFDDEYSHLAAVKIQSLGRRIIASNQLVTVRDSYHPYIPGLEIMEDKRHEKVSPLDSYNLIPGNFYLYLLEALMYGLCVDKRRRSDPRITFERLQKYLFDIVPRESIPERYLARVEIFLDIASYGSVKIHQESQRLTRFHIASGSRVELFHMGMSNPAMEYLTRCVWDHLEKSTERPLCPLHPSNRIVANGCSYY